jgi:hypothetical protein
VNAAQLLKHAIEGLQLEKVQAIARIPEVKSLYDLKSQLINSTLSPGHMVELQGTRLKVNLLQKDEGIFLVNSSDGAVFKDTADPYQLAQQAIRDATRWNSTRRLYSGSKGQNGWEQKPADWSTGSRADSILIFDGYDSLMCKESRKAGQTYRLFYSK